MSEYATKLRTHTCGELRTEHAAPAKPARRPTALDDMDVVLPRGPAIDEGKVTLAGHVDRKVDDTTLLLRDHYGKTLVAVAPDALPYVAERFGKVGPEDVVTVSGDVALRSERQKDPANPTGEVFLQVKKIEILSIALPLPDGIMTGRPPLGDRVTYRQLYLRRPEMQERLALRSTVAREAREFFLANQFLEIDTPQLFLFDAVASRSDMVPVSAQRAFSLSGGPLVGDTYIRPSGFDRFFQILQVTTNEREMNSPLHGQEFTALDMNMAYVDMPDFMGMVEGLLAHVWKAALGVELKTPFRRLTWHEAMLRYGSEKPDVRFGLEISDLGEAAGAGTTSRAFRAPGAAKLSNAELDDAAGAGASWARVLEGGKLEGPAAGPLAGKAQTLGAQPGDALVVGTAAKPNAAARAAGQARVRFGRKLGLVEKGRHDFAWVHTLPCFDDDGRPAAIVFSQLARPEDVDILVERRLEDAKKTQAKQFDLICDGIEIASGYIGMHYLTMQRRFWENIHGLDLTDMARMRAPIEAHRFGCPPYGSMNIGLDRLLSRMANVESIDEVMAYPKTGDCKMPFTGAPAPVPPEAARFVIESDTGMAPALEEEKIEA
jgi:aspartyl-tRNA synthetase